MSASFDHMATVSASTERAVSAAGLTTHLSGLSILPLMPVSPETIERLGLNSPREQKETFAKSQAHTDDGIEVAQVPDIREGDRLVISGVKYPVQAVGEWNDGTYDYLDIVVDKQK